MNDQVNKMWAGLSAYQPRADANGHSDSWKRMCLVKTEMVCIEAADAAEDADDAVADAARKASLVSYYSEMATDTHKAAARAAIWFHETRAYTGEYANIVIEARVTADAALATLYAQRAIDCLAKAQEKE
jgi:hypothetical protein